MDKLSRIQLMRRKKKLFPWLRTFCGKYSEKFFSSENDETFEYLFLNVEKEMNDIYSELNKEKAEDFFNILNSFFLHFWWHIRWKSSKKWEKYWKKVKSTKVSTDDSHRKCCVRLLYYMILLSIFLTGGDEKSDWIGRILTAIKSLPDAVDIICSALLLTRDLRKKHKPVYAIILKHTLCCETVKHTTEPQTYCKVILLFRRLLKLTKDKKEKAPILHFTSKLKVPCDIQNWLSSLNIEESKDLNYDDNFTQELLSRSYPDDLLRKLLEILTEHSFSKRTSFKVDSVDASNVPPNVTSKEDVLEDINSELSEDYLESVESSIEIGLNGMRTNMACVAAENTSNGVNHKIKDKDLCSEVSNPMGVMSSETNVNHCSESLKKSSKNRKLENEKNGKPNLKKNKKKCKEKPDKTAVKINAEFETCSKQSVSASGIEVQSNVSSKENASEKDLSRGLDKDLLGSLFKTNIENGLNNNRAIASCSAAEGTSNDINNSTKEKYLFNEVSNSVEGMFGEENERPNHKKKKKDTDLKESSKIKKKSKEKPNKTAVKINEEIENYSKLSDSVVPPNVTSKENISEDLYGKLDEDFLNFVVKADIHNGFNSIKTTTSCKASENTANDINNMIKDKNLNNAVSDPIEGICSETNINHCSESLKKAPKKRKREKEENDKHNHKKKKKDKTLKESSKNSKKKKKDKTLKESSKNSKKSKNKSNKTAVKVNEKSEIDLKLTVPASNIGVLSNAPSKENISGDLNSELDENLLESLLKTSIQSDSNSIKAITSSVAAENISNDINYMIEDLNNAVSDSMEGIYEETDCPESSENAPKKQKHENEVSERHNHKKKKKDKTLKELSNNSEKKKKDSTLKESSKNSKKSKKKSNKTAVKINEKFGIDSKLNVPASNIGVLSNAPPKENISGDLNGELDENLLESLPKTSIQNDSIKATTSSITTENISNDIDYMIKDKDLSSIVLNPMEEIYDETDCLESSDKAPKKHENKVSEKHNHKKKKKDKTLKESSKNSKKKRKDKTLKESSKNSKKKRKDKTLKESSEDSSIQNYSNCIKATISSVTAENISNDINYMIKDKDLNNIVLNPMEEICDETDCPESLEKQKHENEVSKRHNHKKKKKDKTSKKSSKDHKKKEKKSKEKPDKNKDIDETNVLKKEKEVKSSYKKSKSHKHKKKSNKKAVEINIGFEPCSQLSLATSVVEESHMSRKALDKEVETSHEQHPCSLKSGSKKHSDENINQKVETQSLSFVPTSNIVESQEFENPLNQMEISHEQQDNNLEPKRKKSKSEKQKEEEKHFKKSTKPSQDKKVTKLKKVTDLDHSDTILPVKNFTDSENGSPQIEDQSQTKKIKKRSSEKLKKSSECIKTADLDDPDGKNLKMMSKENNSSDFVSEGNYSRPSLRKENVIDELKKSSTVRMKKLFNNNLYCLTNSQKESQPCRSIDNCIDMPSANTNIESNFSSCEETTVFSDITISEILKRKIDPYRYNSILGIEDGHNLRTKTKQKPNSKDNEHKKELSILKNDLLMASKKILQQSYISESCTSPNLFDNESGVKETENDNNQKSEMLSSHSTNIKESVIDSDMVTGNNVSNECKSTAVFQQSCITNNTEDTFLSMDYLSGQDFEAGKNIRTSSECSFSSFSHSSLNPSIVLKDVLKCKSAQKYISASEKSFTSISESHSETRSSTPAPSATNREINVGHELTLENIAKANELYGENYGALMNYFCTDQKYNLPCIQNVSTLPIDEKLNNHTELNEFHSPSGRQTANSNIFLNEFQSELLNNSVSQSLFNASVMKNETIECGTQYSSTETVNYKSVGTATEIDNSNDLAVNCINSDNPNESSNNISSVQVVINYTNKENDSASKKQFVANFDFQTINSHVRTPLLSSVLLHPDNTSPVLINNIHNQDLDSTENYHIIPFNLATNSIENSVNFDKCNNTLNDSGLTQTHCITSSPTIVNSQVPLNSTVLNNGKEAFFDSSFSKNYTPLSKDVDLKHLTTENLDSLNRNSNEFSLEAKDINNDSSYRTSTIYSDESEDDGTTSTMTSSDIETELLVGETLEIGTSSKPLSCKNESSPIIKSEPVIIDDNTKSKKLAQENSDLSKTIASRRTTPKKNLPPINQCNTISKTFSKEDSSLPKKIFNKGKTLENIPPVNHRYNLRVRK